MVLAATPAIRASDLVPHPTQAGKFLVQAPPSLAQPGKPWLTVLPDNTLTVSGDTGEYQTAQKAGSGRIAFVCLSQYPTGVYAFPLLEDL